MTKLGNRRKTRPFNIWFPAWYRIWQPDRQRLTPGFTVTCKILKKGSLRRKKSAPQHLTKFFSLPSPWTFPVTELLFFFLTANGVCSWGWYLQREVTNHLIIRLPSTRANKFLFQVTTEFKLNLIPLSNFTLLFYDKKNEDLSTGNCIVATQSLV